MAEMGTLSVAFELVDKTTGNVNKITKSLDDIAKGGQAGQKEIDKLEKSIANLGKASKQGAKPDLTKGATEQAIKQVEALKKQYVDLYQAIDRVKTIRPNFDTSAAQAQLHSLATAIAAFYKESSNGAMIFNKNAVVSSFTGLDPQWNASAITRLKEGTKTALKAVADDEREGKKAVQAYQIQIAALKDYVIKHNTWLKNLEKAKASAPSIDHSRFDSAIRFMRTEIASFIGMLEKLGDTRYGTAAAYIQKYGLDARRVAANTPDASMHVTTGTRFFSNDIWNDTRTVRNNRDWAYINDKYRITGTEKEQGEHLRQLDGYIKKFERKQREFNAMTFAPGTDLSKFKAMQSEIERTLAIFRHFKSEVEKGNLSDRSLYRFYNKNLDGTIGEAKRYTKNDEKGLKALEREFANADIKGANLERTIIAITEQMRRLGDASKQKGVSGGTLGQLNNAFNALLGQRDLYRMIQGDQSMLGDKVGLAKTGQQLAIDMYAAQKAINAANVEHKDFNKTQQEAARRQKEIDQAYANARSTVKQYLGSIEQEKSRLQQLLSIRDRLVGTVRDAHANGYSVRGTGIGEQLKAVNAAIGVSQQYIAGNGADRTAASSIAELRRNAANAVKEVKGLANAHGEAQKQADRNAQAVKNLVHQYNQLSNAANKSGSAISSIKGELMQFAPIYGVQQLVMSIIEVGGEIEKQHIALQSILGDLHNANELFSDLKQLALKSPFTFGELTKDVKQLAAYNVEYDEMYDTTKRLADISSGLGVSFERIALAYGQVKSRSWLDGKELRQFAYAGVPLLQMLSKMYSESNGSFVSTAQVRKMITNREVSFEDVQKVLWDLTNEGGKFYNMQEILSETLLGRYNKLKDAWEIMLADFARGESVVGGTFKTILNMITSVVLALNSASGIVAAFFSGFALKKLGGLVGMSLGSAAPTVTANVIASKQLQAAKLKEIALTRELSVAEQQIVAHKNKAVFQDYKALAAANALTKADLQRLYITGQINARQAQQLATMLGIEMSTKRTAVASNLLWTNIKGGISKAVTGAFNFMGGWVGIATTAAAMIGMKLWSIYDEASEVGKRTEEEVKGRYEDIKKFIDGINKTLTFDANGSIVFDEKNIDDQIRAMREEIKKMVPSLYGDIVLGVSGDSQSQATNLLHELEKIKAAFSLSGEIGDAIRKAEIASNHILNENMKENLQEMVDGGWLSATNGDSYDAQMTEYMESIRGYLKDKKPFMRKYIAAFIKESAHEGLSDAAKTRFDYDFDKALGLDVLPSLVQRTADQAGTTLSDGIKAKLSQGLPITTAEKKDLDKAITATLNDFKKRFPYMADEIQRALTSRDFFITVRTEMSGNNRPNELLEYYRGLIPGMTTDALRPRVESRLGTLLAEGSVSKAISTSAGRIKDLRQEIKDLKRKGPNADNVKKVKDSLDLEELVFSILGGTEADIAAKDKSRKNNKDIQLMRFQKRIDAIKKLIALYEHYRKLYGKDVANEKVSAKAKEEDVVGYDFSKPESVFKRLADEAPKGSEERKNVWRGLITSAEEEKRKEEERTVDSLTKSYEQFNNRLKEQYEIRDAIRRRFGKETSFNLAGAGIGITNNDSSVLPKGTLDELFVNGNKNTALPFIEAKEREIQRLIDKYNLSYTVDQLLSLADNEEALTSAFGKGILSEEDSVNIISAIKALYDAKLQKEKEDREAVLSAIDESGAYNLKMEGIKESLKDLVERIDKSGLDQNIIDILKGDATNASNKKRNALLVEQIAKGLSVEGILNNVNSQTKEMLSFIDNALSSIAKNSKDIDPENLRRLLDLIYKVREKNLETSGMFKGLGDSVDNLKSAKERYESLKKMTDIYKFYIDELNDPNTSQKRKDTILNGNKIIDVDTGRLITIKELFDELAAAMDNVSRATNHMNDAVRKYTRNAKSIGNITKNILGLFSGGEEVDTVSAVFDGFTSVLDSIENIDFSKSIFDLQNLEQVSNVIAGIGNTLNNISQIRAAARQREMEQIRTENANMIDLNERLISSIEKKLSSASGVSLFNDNYNDLMHSYDTQQSLVIGQANSVLSQMYKTYKQIDHAPGNSSDRNSVYGYMWKGEKGYQNWEDIAADVNKQFGTSLSSVPDFFSLNREQLEWVIQNYPLAVSQVTELKEAFTSLIQYKEYAEKVSPSQFFLGSDWDTFYSNFKNQCNDIEATVEDLANSIYDQLNGAIVNALINAKYKQQLENLYNTIGSFYTNGDDPYGVGISTSEANALKAMTESISKGIHNDVKALKDAGVLFDTSSNSSSSMTSSIKGVTEDTADLLASYINAIRADVSINRTLMQKAFEETLPSINSNCYQSLVELRGIKSTLDAMAGNMLDVRDMIYDMTIGAKAVSVRMTNVA